MKKSEAFIFGVALHQAIMDGTYGNAYEELSDESKKQLRELVDDFKAGILVTVACKDYYADLDRYAPSESRRFGILYRN